MVFRPSLFMDRDRDFFFSFFSLKSSVESKAAPVATFSAIPSLKRQRGFCDNPESIRTGQRWGRPSECTYTVQLCSMTKIFMRQTLETIGETPKHSFGLLSVVNEPDFPVYNYNISLYAYLDKKTENFSSDR